MRGIVKRVVAHGRWRVAARRGAVLVDFAHVSRCFIPAMLRVMTLGDTLAPKTARLWQRLQRSRNRDALLSREGIQLRLIGSEDIRTKNWRK